MEISKKIVGDEIGVLKEQYTKLEELFTTKSIPECRQIIETIDGLKEIKCKKKYPDLKSKYTWLRGYSGKTLYIFSVTNFPYDGTEIEKIFEEEKTQVSLCRINKSSPEWENVNTNKAVCLYVGSSEDISQRLKEHLFWCNPNTYAMHLENWFPNDVSITIDTWNFWEFLNGENPDHLQNIEDILWNHYKPLFGRQGKK
ncbi:hypothetical protein FACS1894151_11330 [Spirochaetia bacterium]|nr:hypothetical protein FACS1894151_11330 [Spirochaetia bacterium]